MPTGKSLKQKEQPKCVLCIDQSYTRLGVAVVENTGIVKFASSIDLSKMKNRTQKRNAVRELIRMWILTWRPKALIVERVRVFAGKYISADTMGALAAMTAIIVDAAYVHSYDTNPIPVFSVDTRSWKLGVLGDSRASKDDAVHWLKKKHKIAADHDAADAAAMGVYALMNGSKRVREK